MDVLVLWKSECNHQRYDNKGVPHGEEKKATATTKT